MTDQTTETARALLYRYGLPEDVIDGALCLHARELAAVQRAAIAKTDDPVFYEGEAGWLVNVIEPDTTPATPLPMPADEARTRLLQALDASYCQALGFSPEGLLAAYEASRTQTVDQAALSVAEARDRLRGMALTLATGEGPLVEPWAFNQALDDYQAAVAAAVLPATTNHDTDTDVELRAEVDQWRATFGRDALPGALRRLERAEAERDSLGREADRLRKDWVEMRDRAERAEADRRAVLREAADIAEAQRQFEPAYGARKSAQVSENVGILRVAARLRRVADETAATATQARRGDQVEAWLKQQRDDHPRSSHAWFMVDCVLDRYRLHADTGTPLGEHVCEARVVGDCECLEQPTEATAAPVQHAPGKVIRCLDCRDKGYTVCQDEPAAGARQDGAQPGDAE